MSYILDALRKADAERERGTVPGIHAQPIFAGAPASAGARRGVPPWVWVAGAALALVLVAVIAWALLGGAGGSAPRTIAEPVAPAPAAAPLAAMEPRPAPSPAPASAVAPMTAAPMTAAPASAPAPAPAVAAKPASAETPVVRRPAPPVAARAALTEPRVAAAPASAPTASAPKPEPKATAEDRVYTLKELPDDIRRQLPNVNVGGSMYSANKADRILIINGQVLHEGDAIAPGLMLEQIKLKAAVLAFKGYRYAIAF